MICETCEIEVPDGSGRCSSSPALVCLGTPPEPGCGAVLTPEERHWYGACCETCTRRCGDRIEAWRRGGADRELDAIWDAKPERH